MTNVCAGKNIAWLLPGIIRGSGGHRTIIEKIRRLDSLGAINQIHFYDVEPSRRQEMMSILSRHFGYSSDRVYAGPVGGVSCDIAIATLWDGVRLLREMNAPHKAHFIQDFEAYFNAMGDGYLMAELAYQEPVHQIVLGKWLSNVMKTRYDREPFTCDFGVDTETYKVTKPWAMRSRSVAFIFQPEKPRRAWRIGIEALGMLKSRNPDVEIFLYGSDEQPSLWFKTTNLGIISTRELAHLYNSIKVGLCISSSNPSRIPFEMMACGLPLVDLYLSNNLYEYPDNSLLLAHNSPESIAAGLEFLLNDRRLGEYVSNRAINFVCGKTEDTEHDEFVNAVTAILDGQKGASELFPLKYKSAPVIDPLFADNPHVAAYCRRQVVM